MAKKASERPVKRAKKVTLKGSPALGVRGQGCRGFDLRLSTRDPRPYYGIFEKRIGQVLIRLAKRRLFSSLQDQRVVREFSIFPKSTAAFHVP